MLSLRGITWICEGHIERGMADCDEAVRLDEKSAIVRNNRAYGLSRIGEHEAALADCNEAIRLDPTEVSAYKNRGIAHVGKRQYVAALADFAEAIRLVPTLASAYEARAWMLATCLDKRFRSGKQAVEDATKACELHGWKDPNHLTALSAAYAEAGDFDAAFSWQSKADELAQARTKILGGTGG